MGASSSAPEPSLECFSDDEQRTLLSNFQSLARHNAGTPTFSQSDFLEVHAAIPHVLGTALFRIMCTEMAEGGEVTCDTAVIVLATLRLDSPPGWVTPRVSPVNYSCLDVLCLPRHPASHATLRMLYDAAATPDTTAAAVLFRETLRSVLDAASTFLAAIPKGTHESHQGLRHQLLSTSSWH